MAVNANEMRLKALYAKRDMLFSRMQNICDHAKNIHLESVQETFLCEIETIDSLRSDFESVLDKINSFELQIDPDYVVNYQSLSSFEDLLCRVKRAARRLQPVSQRDVKPAVQVQSRDAPRLPPIDIPMFNGDIKTWPLFFASFQNTIHNNPSLSDTEKLYYLIGKLGGKAQSVCAGLTPTADNYLLILESLKNKYEDKRMLASSYLDQIFDLKTMSSANVHNLELFLDKFATSVAALKNLKFNDLMDFVFLHIALKKLDPDTVRSFEMENRGSDIPSFDVLTSFVRNQIKILQRSSNAKQEAKKCADRRMDAPSKPMKSLTYVNTAPAFSHNACFLCKTQHDHLYNCAIFRKRSPSERYKIVKSNNLCLNCLSNKHRVSNCNSNSVCHKCRSRHHTMLHFENNAASTLSKPASNSLPTVAGIDVSPTIASDRAHTGHTGALGTSPHARPDDVALCSLSSDKEITHAPATVLLGTARVIVIDSHGNELSVRVLLDSASQSNFITQQCCQRLGLVANKTPSCPVVKGIGGFNKTVQGSVNLKFYSRFDHSVNFCISSLVVDKVTERLPTVSVNVSVMTNFNNLALADDTYSVPGDIDMLIGASIFPHLLLYNKVKGNPSRIAPYALETVLGYVIVGSAPVVDSFSAISYCCTAVEPLELFVRKFWEIEEVNVPPILSPDDRLCEEIYVRTTVRDRDGRYIVALPFKGDILSLGDSRQMAEKRFNCLERKMLALPKLKEAYDDVINEYLKKGYISPALPTMDDSKETPSYFIPHHGVIREDKLTSKLRAVLDASAKTSTLVSLNDILYSG